MNGKKEFEIDLPEVRRRLVAMRSHHLHDLNVTTSINKLLGKLAYLREPKDRSHEKRLMRMISKTLDAIQRTNAAG